MNIRFLNIFFIAGLLLANSAVIAKAKVSTVDLPVTISHKMLHSIIVARLFKESGMETTVLNEEDGCRYITLSKPRLIPDAPFIKFEVFVDLQYGKKIAGRCIAPIRWSGYVELLHDVIYEINSWKLVMRTLDSRVYDSEHKSAYISGFTYNLLKSHVHTYIENIHVDLTTPINEMKRIIPAFALEDNREQAEAVVKSLRPGGVTVTNSDIIARAVADVELAIKEAEPEDPLTDEELPALMEKWEAWDSFLIHTISQMRDTALDDEDRETLISTLLKTRHQLLEGLTDFNLKGNFVRATFREAWGDLAPVFRKSLYEGSTGSLLGYLSFFTASDALKTLDSVGPAFGLEMSQDGLIRLARLMNQRVTPTLDYKSGVDPNLRKTLGLGAPLEESGPSFEEDEIDIEDIDHDAGVENGPISYLIFRYLAPPSAWASKKKTKQSIRQWIPWDKTRASYMNRVKALLLKAAKHGFEKGKLNKSRREFFDRLMLSTAWQESCFKQFKVRKRKVTYLRSYNNTSVGIMQINERVWRGVYNKASLRWNIDYNARAGAEILEMYMRQHALHKIKKYGYKLDEGALARSVYAIYNGGPSQFMKFIKRRKKGRYYKSDKLYWQKYRWVRDDQWNKIRKCY